MSVYYDLYASGNPQKKGGTTATSRTSDSIRNS